MAQAATGNTVAIETDITPFELRTGHHPALFALFFAEMWERFSYYGMRALLVLYMQFGFLRYTDHHAYDVYGAYTALVYMTPFIGGFVADRVLGQRTAVVFGGALMALGHLVMTVENDIAFFSALALLIVGNGFFKPNIGTIVGSLYGGRLEPKRDAAFTIFYMGVNLGAAISPLLCAFLADRYGWHFGFGLATIGMLIGLAIFVAPTIVTQVLVGLGACATAAGLILSSTGQSVYVMVPNVLTAVALLVAMVFALWALANGSLPAAAGESPAHRAARQEGRAVTDAERSRQRLSIIGVVVAAFAVVPLFAYLCEHPIVAKLVLVSVGVIALGYVGFESTRVTQVERRRLGAILILCVFSMMFWAFFELAGSAISNFTDRNVDRVSETRVVTTEDVGRDLTFTLTQEQIGYPHDGAPFTLDQFNTLRNETREANRRSGANEDTTVTWRIEPAHVGMGVDGPEIPAAAFQSANPIFILLFGLVFAWLWTALARMSREPSTPVKFVFGLAQLGLGFAVLWVGAGMATARGMVGVNALILAYLLHTTGELCISPVGLSMVSRLAPPRMVATMMGIWYLATAFSQTLSSMIAQLTSPSAAGLPIGTMLWNAIMGIEPPGEGGASIALPSESLAQYANVFGTVALFSFGGAIVLLVIARGVVFLMGESRKTA